MCIRDRGGPGRPWHLGVVCEGFLEQDFSGSGFEVREHAIRNLDASGQFLAEPPGLADPDAEKPEEPGEILWKIKESGDDKEENQQLDDQGVFFSRSARAGSQARPSSWFESRSKPSSVIR